MAAYRAVTFDLLSALADSRAVFDAVAGDATGGGRWRDAQLRLATGNGSYRPFEQIIAEAAAEAGIADGLAQRLVARWGEIAPYPDTSPVLSRLAASGLKLLILTNCAQRMAELVAARIPVRWHAVVSAEAAGYYKPHPQAYAAGCKAAGHPAAEILFVPGRAQDLAGATRAGHPAYWVNRGQQPVPTDVRPLAIEPTLHALPALLGI